jgi:hypothetical protein
VTQQLVADLGIQRWEWLSLTMAARTRGIRLATLRDAIKRGDISAELVQRRTRTWYRIRSDLLDEALERLRCKHRGCDRLALGKTGGCSPAHGAALALTGRERPPEVVEKVAEANRRYARVERFCTRCGDSLGLVSEALVRRGKKKLCSRCAGVPKYQAEERFCEWCGKSLGIVPGWIVHAGGGRFCNRSHAKKWLVRHHPEKWEKPRTGREVTCPGCGETRYYPPADVPKTGYCRKCVPDSPQARESLARASSARRKNRAREVRTLVKASGSSLISRLSSASRVHR